MLKSEKKGLKQNSKASKMVSKLNSTIQNLHNLKVTIVNLIINSKCLRQAKEVIKTFLSSRNI